MVCIYIYTHTHTLHCLYPFISWQTLMLFQYFDYCEYCCNLHGRNSSTLATSCKELTHWKRLWCWEGLGAGGEGDDPGWDGWMASLTRWTWVWVNSGRWWWTGRPGELQFVGSQRVGHDWATELNWTSKFSSTIVVILLQLLHLSVCIPTILLLPFLLQSHFRFQIFAKPLAKYVSGISVS